VFCCISSGCLANGISVAKIRDEDSYLPLTTASIMGSLPITFKDVSDLIRFAKEYLVENRLNSLDNDVKRCLTKNHKKEQLAPFPAILYCFSVLDLLGSLYGGHARRGSTVENTRIYMQKFMSTSGRKYEDWQISLLQKIFRHKLVHLSEPKAVFLYDNKIIGWRHDEEDIDGKHHLQIREVGEEELSADIFGRVIIKVDGEFVVSISKFKDEIIDSVKRDKNGYLAELEKNSPTSNKFVVAINQIFDTMIID